MPVDISSWHGLWTLERIRQTKFRPSLKSTLLDFNLGYLVTSVLAVFFVVLGTYLFFGSSEALPNNNAQFAEKVVTMYTQTIGSWNYLIIAAASFSVMFGTIIAVFDGYSRAVRRTILLLRKKTDDDVEKTPKFRKLYFIILVSLAVGSAVVVISFGRNLKELLDFATAVSFVIAPIIAVFNYKLVSKKYLSEGTPPRWLNALAVAGIIFLAGFAVFFLLIHFLPGYII
jgi:Mn2+/Fe2+ NRAMP family transporter